MICIDLILKLIHSLKKYNKILILLKELIIPQLNIVMESIFLEEKEKINKFLMMFGNLNNHGLNQIMINKLLEDLVILLYHIKIQCLFLVDGMELVVQMKCMNIHLLLIPFMKLEDAVDKNLKPDIDMKHQFIIQICFYLVVQIIYKLDIMIYINIILKKENGLKLIHLEVFHQLELFINQLILKINSFYQVDMMDKD